MTLLALWMALASGVAPSVPSSFLAQAKPAVSARTNPEDVLCTIRVVNEDPSRILQLLSEQTGANLMLLSPSGAKITVNMVNVPLGQMIRHIAALTGLRHLVIGRTFVLASADKLKEAYPAEWLATVGTDNAAPVEKPKTITEVYQTNFVSASKLAEALTKLYGEELAAVAGPVQSNPSLTTQEAGSATGGSGAGMISGSATADAGSGRILVLRGPEPLVREALAMAGRMDESRHQVAIDVSIVDISDTALRELGLNWNFGGFAITETGNRGVNFGRIGRTPIRFDAVIDALEQKDRARVLASPNISVLDGERAFILIGDRINFPVVIGFSDAGSPIFSKEEERVGIYLQVAASVSRDDQITLTLYPQVSTVTGFLEVNGASYPQISTREAQTTLRVKSGETMVMGGLLKTEEIRQMQKVPLLGDIPILGELFRRRRTTTDTSQVLISLTPTLIRGS